MSGIRQNILVLGYACVFFLLSIADLPAAEYFTGPSKGWPEGPVHIVDPRSGRDSLSRERELRDALMNHPPFFAQPEAGSYNDSPRYDPEPSRGRPPSPAAAQMPASASASRMPAQQVREQAIFYYQRGTQFFGLQKWLLAVEQFNLAIESDPRLAQAYAVRGLAYAAVGQFDKAINDSTVALALNPKLSFAYETRAIGNYARRRYDEAWMDVRKAMQMGHTVDPKFLSDLRHASGRWD